MTNTPDLLFTFWIDYEWERLTLGPVVWPARLHTIRRFADDVMWRLWGLNGSAYFMIHFLFHRSYVSADFSTSSRTAFISFFQQKAIKCFPLFFPLSVAILLAVVQLNCSGFSESCVPFKKHRSGIYFSYEYLNIFAFWSRRKIPS